MAIRPVYIINEDDYSVEKKDIEFDWVKGMHISRKLLCAKSLQKSAAEKLNLNAEKFIEISSCSDIDLGKNLSAFNLKTNFENKSIEYSVESAFQSAKVFEKAGPFKDIIYLSSRDAKKDLRLKENGNLKHFNFYGEIFEADGTTLFYDWIYINVLLKNEHLHDEIMKYRAFTDIAFNPKEMVNTQAFSIALFVALKLKNTDMSNFRDAKVFKEVTKDFYTKLMFSNGRLI